MDSAAVPVQPCLVPFALDNPNVRRFGPWSYVQDTGNAFIVVVRGALIGRFQKDDSATRNVLLVAAYQACRRGEVRALTKAFEISPGTLWYLCQAFAKGGAKALVERTHGGARYRRLTETKQRRAERLFEAGATVSEVQQATGLSRGSVSRARSAWQGHKQQQEPPLQPISTEDHAEEQEELESIPTLEPRSGSHVQHAGSWLLIAMAAALGLHATAESKRPSKLRPGLLRLALDAFVIALAIGERCAEGVRRLATTSAGTLLLAAHAPSASWVRRVLHRFADDGNGSTFQFTVAGDLARAAADGEEVAVYYVDNHLRSYTGQQVVRKGWRMQDRRAVPGTTDYYVHDEDGRPVFRIDSPQHDSLSAILGPAAACLRVAVGEEQKILLAFDRGGSFPSAMAELRDAGVDFVTYERRPYAVLAQSKFERTITLEGGEVVRLCELHEKNLGRGRGRVRRICLQMEDGHQVNLLAISELEPERLVEIMTGRWRQENAFKHGKERWGINQLDGRRCELVPPGTIIPNPARRRLDHALDLVRRWEGEVRNRLARAGADRSRRAALKEELAKATALRGQYEQQQPSLPTHAPVEETVLAGKLVRHAPDYKMALDAIRTICANAESELAASLGPLLPRPEEAKRLLRNLFLSPGRIDIGADCITVILQPAASTPELNAIAQLFASLDRNDLVHPGDSLCRKLRFRLPSIQSG